MVSEKATLGKATSFCSPRWKVQSADLVGHWKQPTATSSSTQNSKHMYVCMYVSTHTHAHLDHILLTVPYGRGGTLNSALDYKQRLLFITTILLLYCACHVLWARIYILNFTSISFPFYFFSPSLISSYKGQRTGTFYLRLQVCAALYMLLHLDTAPAHLSFL